MGAPQCSTKLKIDTLKISSFIIILQLESCRFQFYKTNSVKRDKRVIVFGFQTQLLEATYACCPESWIILLESELFIISGRGSHLSSQVTYFIFAGLGFTAARRKFAAATRTSLSSCQAILNLMNSFEQFCKNSVKKKS